MSELYTIPKHHQPRLRGFSLRKCEFPKNFQGKSPEEEAVATSHSEREEKGYRCMEHPEIWNLQINWCMTWFFLTNFGHFCQMVSSVTVNSRLVDTSVLRAAQNTDGMATRNYAEEFANWLKSSFLGVADFTRDDDDIAKVHRLVDFRPRLQNLDFDGLECNRVNSLNFSHCTAPGRNETAPWEDD